MPDAPYLADEAAFEAATSRSERQALSAARAARWAAITGAPAGTAEGVRRLRDAGELSPDCAASLLSVLR